MQLILAQVPYVSGGVLYSTVHLLFGIWYFGRTSFSSHQLPLSFPVDTFRTEDGFLFIILKYSFGEQSVSSYHEVAGK